MKPTEESPSTPEISDQLSRMLSAKRFRNAPNQSALLELVVRRAAHGKKTPGRIIAKAIFGDKFLQGESTDVRVTAANLRSSLRKYYASEGSAELVIIALPEPPKDRTIKLAEGDSYTPEFSYNPFHAVSSQVKLGQYFLVRGMYEDSVRSVEHFTSALRQAPHHIGAAIGIAEAQCRTLYWEEEAQVESPKKDETIEDAARWLDRVYERAAELWHLHAAAGFLHLVNGDLSSAQESFDRALALDRAATEAYPPYLEFLVKSSNKVEGLRLARRYLDIHVDSVRAHTQYARILLLSGQVEAATEATEAAFDLDSSSYRVHLMLSKLRAMQERPRETLMHLDYLKRLADKLTFGLTTFEVGRVIAEWPEQAKSEFRTELLALRLESDRMLSAACDYKPKPTFGHLVTNVAPRFLRGLISR